METLTLPLFLLTFIFGVMGGVGGVLLSLGLTLNEQGQAVPKQTWLGRSLKQIVVPEKMDPKDPLRFCQASSLLGMLLFFGTMLTVTAIGSMLSLLVVMVTSNTLIYDWKFMTSVIAILGLIVGLTYLMLGPKERLEKYFRVVVGTILTVMGTGFVGLVAYSVYTRGWPKPPSSEDMMVLGIMYGFVVVVVLIYKLGKALLKYLGILDTMCPVIPPLPQKEG